METLRLDCTQGARKDALVAALFGMLTPEAQTAFAERFARVGLDGATVDDVLSPEPPQTHHHDHHSLDEVRARICALGLSDVARSGALGVYEVLAAAEAKAHGVPVEQVHFHEVGNARAIASIVAFSMLVDELAPESIVATPITTGFGFVDCAHGRLPIPAPATANILEGLPTRRGDVEGELTTPTGAALVRHFAHRFEPSC